MRVQLNYVMKFVDDMDKAVRFYRDTLGLLLKFQSPGWSEFSTGDVTLALHPASERNPAGSVRLGFHMEGLEKLFARGESSGLRFTSPPHREHGILLATFLDSDGAECVAGE